MVLMGSAGGWLGGGGRVVLTGAPGGWLGGGGCVVLTGAPGGWLGVGGFSPRHRQDVEQRVWLCGCDE